MECSEQDNLMEEPLVDNKATCLCAHIRRHACTYTSKMVLCCEFLLHIFYSFFSYCSGFYICLRCLFIFIYSFAGSHPYLLDKYYLHACHVPAIVLGTHDPSTYVNFYWCLLQLLKGIIFFLFSRALLEDDIVPGVSDN